MEAINKLIEAIELRIADLLERAVELSEDPYTEETVYIQGAVEELKVVLDQLVAIAGTREQVNNAPKVIGAIKLDGNIEQQFMEAQIQEWEEDYYDGF